MAGVRQQTFVAATYADQQVVDAKANICAAFGVNCDVADAHLKSCAMEPLQVSDALQVLAGNCRLLANEVTAGIPPRVGSVSQPSSAAIDLGHTGVQATAATVTTRIHDTGGDLDDAWMAYDQNETASAVKLRASVEQVD
jgi:hypothetical protein